MEPKFPDIKVELTGVDGNAYAVIAKCKRAASRTLSKQQWDEFFAEATSGDYDKVIQTAMKWFEVV